MLHSLVYVLFLVALLLLAICVSSSVKAAPVIPESSPDFSFKLGNPFLFSGEEATIIIHRVPPRIATENSQYAEEFCLSGVVSVESPLTSSIIVTPSNPCISPTSSAAPGERASGVHPLLKLSFFFSAAPLVHTVSLCATGRRAGGNAFSSSCIQTAVHHFWRPTLIPPLSPNKPVAVARLAPGRSYILAIEKSDFLQSDSSSLKVTSSVPPHVVGAAARAGQRITFESELALYSRRPLDPPRLSRVDPCPVASWQHVHVEDSKNPLRRSAASIHRIELSTAMVLRDAVNETLCYLSLQNANSNSMISLQVQLVGQQSAWLSQSTEENNKNSDKKPITAWDVLWFILQLLLEILA